MLFAFPKAAAAIIVFFIVVTAIVLIEFFIFQKDEGENDGNCNRGSNESDDES